MPTIKPAIVSCAYLVVLDGANAAPMIFICPGAAIILAEACLPGSDSDSPDNRALVGRFVALGDKIAPESMARARETLPELLLSVADRMVLADRLMVALHEFAAKMSAGQA